MSRVGIALLAGLVVGGGTVAFARLVIDDDAAETVVVNTTLATAIRTGAPLDVDGLLPASRSIDARAHTLQTIVAADTDELVLLVWELASRPESVARDYAMAAAVHRLAERDAGQALAALAQTFLDPRAARELALIVLQQLEAEPASIDVVLATLPQIDAHQFQVDAVSILAVSSIEAAIAYAATFEHRPQRERAVAKAAPLLLGNSDEMFAAIDAIEDDAKRRGIEATLFAELATDNLDALQMMFELRYPSADQNRLTIGMETVRMLNARDPDAALAVIDRLSLEPSGGWTRAAKSWKARMDPAAGRALAERPSSEPYDRVRSTIATVLAEQDPDGTIAWLRSLDPMPPDLIEGVISGVARVDPLRAIDLGEELGAVGELNRVDTLAQSASLIAERILMVPDHARRDEWFESLFQSWSWIDDVAAMDWAIANADRIGAEAFTRIGQTRGREDPSAALLELARLPEHAHQPWVDAVMRGAMGADPAAALEWVAQFRGQPFYEMAAASVVANGEWTDLPPVLEVFDTLSEQRQVDLAHRLTIRWHRADAPAARAWVESLPESPVRDRAIMGIIGFSGLDQVDRSLIDLFSSDDARAEALIGTLQQVAARDAAAARQLVDTYIEDPAMQERAELVIQAFQR